MFGLPGHQGAHLPQQLVRQQEKDHRGGKHLVEQRNVQSVLPGPQYRQSVGQHIGQGGGQFALAVEHTGHHPGQGVGHGVKGHPAGGQVHTQTNRHADGGSDADASLVGHRHHRHRGGKAAHRQIPQQGQLGQGEQQGT